MRQRTDLVDGVVFPWVDATDDLDGEMQPVDFTVEQIEQELSSALGSLRSVIWAEIHRRAPGERIINVKYDLEDLEESRTVVALPFWYYEFTVGDAPKTETALVSRINPSFGISQFVARSRNIRVLLGLGFVIVIGVLLFLFAGGG